MTRTRMRGTAVGVALSAAMAIAGSAAAGAQDLPPAAAAFDGERAFADAAAMVELGPRPLNSEALEANRVYIEGELAAVGLEVRRDEFIADTPIGPVRMANLIAPLGPDEGPVILLAGHYDTKLYEGVDFVGANDGASSAALILEIGRALAAHPPTFPVWLVFFDGEEAVEVWTDTDSTYGSRHMVRRLQASGELERIGALVLVDMVGDADLAIPREINSTVWLTDLIWGVAAEIGRGGQFPQHHHAILDDHLPFIEAGVVAVDLIDFDFGPGNRYWHSPFDTLDKISADSLQAVGEVVLASLPRIGAALRPGS